ncbi:MAG: ATP-binding cassette domain-containing protein [Planctomycetia bacterium]|nr:ATP-binding cassette domain-containing protein [Planctomycetia bacterium]
MNQPNPLVALRGVSLTRGDCSLPHLDWSIRPGEVWALVGASGSGKTTLLELLAGTLRVDAGTVDRAIPAAAIAFVAFREQSRAFSYAGHYYQQRYEFADSEEPFVLRQFLNAPTEAEAIRVAAEFGLADKLDLAFLKLSNGQTRRARIAKAVLANPKLLLLDDPFVGLDAAGRAKLVVIMKALSERGTAIVFTALADEVPDGARVFELTKSEPTPSPTAQTRTEQRPIPPDAPAVLELNNVTVRHGGREILSDISWTVRAGERWAIVGPNGAGKTTLLALACGDHPQAFSNDVRLFGRRRGDGETIWDVKKRIGFVSPEFHLYFSEPLTAFEAAATGFHDALLYRPPTEAEAARVGDLFRTFGAAEWMHRPFRQLPTGRQRLALVVRALVKKPELLILDEPFQGMDERTANTIRDWLDGNVSPEQTLIFVTHRPAEIPRILTATLRLDAGRRVNEL